jgi:hypothetical protein
LTDIEDPMPEGLRDITHDDLLPPPPDGFRDLTPDDIPAFRRRYTPPPSIADKIRTNPAIGAPYQGLLRLGQGAESLAAHGAAAASDLLPTYPVKGSGTGKPAPNSLSAMLHGIANHVDEVIGRQNADYEAAGQRVDAASPNPRASMALRRTGEFGGAIAMPGLGEVLPEAQVLGTVGNATLKSGTGGAVYGALQPVQEPPKTERDYWITKAQQAGTGGLTGAVLGAAGAKLSAVRGTVPTSEMYKAMASDAYLASEATGATVPKAGLVGALNSAVAEAHREVTYRPALQPKTATALRTVFEELDQYPGDISFKDIDVTRRVMRHVLDSPEKSERAAAHVIIDGIDDYVRGLNAPEGSALFDARNFFSRGAKLEAVEAAMRKAENAAGHGDLIPSGAHQSRNKFDNAVRTQFAKILNNPRAARQFNADEREVMGALVHGTNLQNVARRIGVLSPTHNAWSLGAELLALGGGSALGHSGESLIASTGVGLAGIGAQKIADSISQGNVDRLKNFIATGRRGMINTPLPMPQRPVFREGEQAIQNGHVYMMVNGVMVPQRRLEQ